MNYCCLFILARHLLSQPYMLQIFEWTFDAKIFLNFYWLQRLFCSKLLEKTIHQEKSAQINFRNWSEWHIDICTLLFENNLLEGVAFILLHITKKFSFLRFCLFLFLHQVSFSRRSEKDSFEIASITGSSSSQTVWLGDDWFDKALLIRSGVWLSYCWNQLLKSR